MAKNEMVPLDRSSCAEAVVTSVGSETIEEMVIDVDEEEAIDGIRESIKDDDSEIAEENVIEITLDANGAGVCLIDESLSSS